MHFEAGDILAFYGEGWISRAIRLGTGGGPSHVGIVCRIDDAVIQQLGLVGTQTGLRLSRLNGEHVVIESTTLIERPCLVTGDRRDGVQVQEPWQRIDDYHGQAVVHRLVPAWRLSTPESQLLTQMLLRYYVLPRADYDRLRVVIAGTTRHLRGLLTRLVAPSPHAQFCSELCAFALMRLNRLNHSNPLAYSPGGLVRELRRQGKTQRLRPTKPALRIWPNRAA